MGKGQRLAPRLDEGQDGVHDAPTVDAEASNSDAQAALHASTSTSTGTPSVLELATREWQQALATTGAAAGRFSQAASTLTGAGDSGVFEELVNAASSALVAAEDHVTEARAWEMGAPEDDRAAAAASRGVYEHGTSHQVLVLRLGWNAILGQSQLGGPSWMLPFEADRPRAALPEVGAMAPRGWRMLDRADAVRRMVARVPDERPRGEMALQRRWEEHEARDAVMPVLDAMGGEYGHEWLFLFDEALRAGLPEWASDALTIEVRGAAEYEAHLQDDGYELDMGKIDRLTHQLRRAVDGAGTVESSILNDEIRNLNRMEIAEIEFQYFERFGGNLTWDLHDDLSGEDYSEAFRSLTGDPVRAATEALENRMDDGWCDPEEIVSVLRAIPPSERERFLAAQQTDPHLARVRDRILSAKYGWGRDSARRDRERLELWFDGRFAEAEALGVEVQGLDRTYSDQHDSGFDTAELGGERVYTADVGRVVKELEKSSDPAALERAFDASHPYTLRDWISNSGSEPQQRLALALLDQGRARERLRDGDPEAAAMLDEARAMETVARVRMGDGQGMRRALYDRDLESQDPVARLAAEQRRARVREAFSEAYDEDLRDYLVRRYTWETDEEQGLYVLDHGRESISIGLYLALRGEWDGTNEAWVKDLLRGASQEEMARAHEEYEARTGRTIETDLRDELSGDDLFDSLVMARGRPETREEIAATVTELQGHHRDGGLGQSVTDWVEEEIFDGHSGADADRQAAWVTGAAADESTEMGELRRRYGWYATSVEDHVAARAQVVEAIKTGAEILAAAIVTIATDGAASPWLVAAIAAAARTTTGLLLGGATHDPGSVPVDVVVGAASAALAGAVEAKILAGGAHAAQGVRKLAVMADDAIAVGGRELRDRLVREAVALLVEQGGTAAIQAAFADGTWDEGLDDGFLAVLSSAFREAGVALATGPLGGRLAPEQLQSGVVHFLAETGTQWIVQQPEDAEAVAFVVHRVLQAATETTGWVNRRPDAAELRRRVDAELDRAMSERDLPPETRERLRAWADQYDAGQLALDEAAGTAAPSALPAVPRSVDPGGPTTAPDRRHAGRVVQHEGQEWTVESSEPGHFVLQRTDPDGTVHRTRVDDESMLRDHPDLEDPLPAGVVARSAHAADPATATRLYNGMIADSTREAAVYQNTEDGEYVVVQGERTFVAVEDGGRPLPAGNAQRWKEILDADHGRWALVTHYHPVHQPDDARMTRLMRFPSAEYGDLGVLMAQSVEAGGGAQVSFIDTVAPWGFTRTEYGTDGAGGFWVEWEEFQGQRQRRAFASLHEYHTFLATEMSAPPPVPQAGTAPAAPASPLRADRQVSPGSEVEVPLHELHHGDIEILRDLAAMRASLLAQERAAGAPGRSTESSRVWSSQLGEHGARAYMRRAFHGHEELPQALFDGAYTFDLVYLDRGTGEVVVVEAKGAGAKADVRKDGSEQGSPKYARDVVAAYLKRLETQEVDDAYAELVQHLQDAWDAGRFRYVQVTTPVQRDGTLGGALDVLEYDVR